MQIMLQLLYFFLGQACDFRNVFRWIAFLFHLPGIGKTCFRFPFLATDDYSFFEAFFSAFQFCGVEDVVLYHDVVEVGIVGSAFLVSHRHVQQAFSCFTQAGGGRSLADSVVLQIVEPFFKRGLGDFVELVDAYDVVFGKDVLGYAHLYLVGFSGVYDQSVAGVYAGEDGLAVVEVIVAFAKVEVQYVDGIDFLHVVVLLADLDVFRDGFGYVVCRKLVARSPVHE